LNLLVTPQLKVRLDLSRTETEANNGQLIPNTTYGGRVDALSATGNNPKLLPYLSNNYDLGAEWYYADNDYVSVDGFFKHVTQFPVSSVQPLTVAGVDLPGTTTPAVFSETTYVNGLAANVTGVEATWQQMLAYGFGYQVNGTYVHSNTNFNPYSYTSNQFALPGIGNSANLIAFYQQSGFQARLAVQWQAKQLLQLGQEQGGGAFGNEPVYLLGNTEVDFTTQYEIDSHLSVFFEALNLTDTVYHTVGRFSNQTLNVVDYGRSFTFGVRAKL
jgi:TonB-dependent receptor